MPANLFNLFNKKSTPQGQPIPESDQVPNSAGGYAWPLAPWARLVRFLVLGSEGGTYYVGEQALTRENALNVLACLKEDGPRFVALVVEFSSAGRAYKNDPALFALALAAAAEDPDTRRLVYAALPRVARTGTHLFHFAAYVDGLRGWGRGLRRALADWYLDKNDEHLAYQLAKYQSRDGWSHRDLLRLAHPKPATLAQTVLFRWAVGNEGVVIAELPGLAQGLERLKSAADEAEVIELVRRYRAPREVIPTQFLTSPAVWRAMLPTLGLTALVRNLGNLSKIGLLVDGAPEVAQVAERLGDAGALRKERVHPLQILAALVTYEQGHGQRGGGEWVVVPAVVAALNAAYRLCFDNLVPTGKRIYLALDVSGSMGVGTVSGIPGLSPRVASGALAMMNLYAEKEVIIKGFSTELITLPVKRSMSLGEVTAVISGLPFAGTDCAQPMLDAIRHNLAVDAFVVYTDSETWAGAIHPSQALRQYRQKTGIPARLVVVGMTSNGFSIADPNDAGMLDVVGFSTDTPAVIADFIAGRLGAPRDAAPEE